MSFYDALSDAVGFLFLAVSLLKDPLLLTSPPSALPEGKGSSRPALTTPRPTITGTQAPVPSRKKDPIEQLKGIMKVTRRLEISRMAQLLEMSEEDLWKRIVPWAQEFGFTIDKNEVEFQTGQVDAFMQELEREFKSWGKRAKQD